MKTMQVTGCLVAGRDGKGRQTEKAVYANLETYDGEHAGSVDSTWLPRSICEGLEVWTEDRSDSVGPYRVDCFRATVPAWWVRKLFSAAWARPIPQATRPL